MGTKGCWNCHCMVRRGKLCVDCVRMLLVGLTPFLVTVLARLIK